jgi:hypothetical protein
LKKLFLFLVFSSTLCCAVNVFAQYTGGDNDGSSTVLACNQNLNGISGLSAGAVAGSVVFCQDATEVYSISPSGTTSATTYTWTVPAGATIVLGQGTTTVVVRFGSTDGNVSVDVANECTTTSSSIAVTLGSCGFYSGGNSDGFSTNIGCIQNLNGGSALLAGSIVGSTTFCSFATEAYSVSVSGATSSTVYTWSVPLGATIVSGQGTTSILVSFGGSDGDVSVTASNECSTTSQTLAVTTASCTFFAGGSNDGFSTNVGCVQNLNGGSALLAGSIVGSTTFCSFATEAYSVSVSGTTSSTVYTWSVPVGATIVSGQGTSSILVSFGGTDGNVSVDVSNECSTTNQSLAVSVSSCLFYRGGMSDGFSTITTGLTPLPVELISFLAVPEDEAIRVTWVTASETNNSFFEVEKSVDGESFQLVARISGAGTTQNRTEYEIVDNKPSPGVSYYRLVQHDFDGTTTFSKLLKIQFTDVLEETIELYPNPVGRGGEVVFRFFAFEPDQLSFSVVSPSGITLQQHVLTLLPGWNNLLDRAVLFETGVYLIPIRTSIKSWVMKLVVQE